MPHLFSPFTLRGLTLKNRIVMAPMCMYSAGSDGRANDWHFVHIGARAVGGAGLLIMEAAAVEPRGRISENDLGLWTDAQIEPLARIVDFVHAQGAAIGIQLAHAGRKAFIRTQGRGPQQPVGPSALPFTADHVTPHPLSVSEIDDVVAAFAAAAQRAKAAGFDLVEIHAAHGYLLHSFVSPLSNQRQDAYGVATLDRIKQRSHLLWRVAEAVRATWPAEQPLFTRISASDWAPGGLTVTDWEPVVTGLKDRGVDLIHCSSGGLVPETAIPIGPGYQTPFAAHLRRTVGIPTAAVGLITSPTHADAIIRNSDADLVALARELLRHPTWPLDAARTLGHDVAWPKQYERAKT